MVSVDADLGHSSQDDLMTCHKPGNRSLDYHPCRYGGSPQTFRGPRRNVEDDYIAFFGGTETYGRFIERPFPALIEKRLGFPCVNLGCVNGGVDSIVRDPGLLSLAQEAKCAVVQMVGAQNTSNRFYTVHPRRNDRVVNVSGMLRAMYREIDFTEYHFTRHLVSKLHGLCPERFAILRGEIQRAWLSKMTSLLKRIPGPVVLLWFSDQLPPKNTETALLDPWLIDRGVINKLREHAQDTLILRASSAALERGTEGMVFGALERDLAKHMLGPSAHEEAAHALCAILSEYLVCVD